MNMSLWIEYAAAAVIVVASFFLLVGAIGLARLPVTYAPSCADQRVHVGRWQGFGCLDAGGGRSGRPGIAELLITLFVFVTAPVSANLLAQAALHLRLPSTAQAPEGSLERRTK
ncbi:MAG: monovalent cation/H(+) antiporter subunit G [Burkholderiaceae bacterium]